MTTISCDDPRGGVSRDFKLDDKGRLRTSRFKTGLYHCVTMNEQGGLVVDECDESKDYPAFEKGGQCGVKLAKNCGDEWKKHCGNCVTFTTERRFVMGNCE